jgi:hypothetical protein
MWKCEQDSSGSGYGPVTGCCEHSYELSDSIKRGEFLHQLSDYQLLVMYHRPLIMKNRKIDKATLSNPRTKQKKQLFYSSQMYTKHVCILTACYICIQEVLGSNLG